MDHTMHIKCGAKFCSVKLMHMNEVYHNSQLETYMQLKNGRDLEHHFARRLTIRNFIGRRLPLVHS